MIVNPDKGIFFVATALMCSASLYGAELSTASPDPMTRVFVGEPSRLTLPPDFPAIAVAVEPTSCGAGPQAALERGAIAIDRQETGCAPAEPGTISDRFARPAALGVASAKSEIPVQPISVGSAERLH